MKSYLVKITVLISCMHFFPSIYGETSNASALFEQANEAYQAQQYEEAIQRYSQIVDAGNEGAILFYNLGNSYFKAGDKAQALLWYERALRLSPSNDDIKHNIAFVNQTLVDKIEVIPQFFLAKWWNMLSGSMTSNAWAIVSLICFTILILFIAFIISSSRSGLRSASLICSMIISILFIFSIILAQKEKSRYEKHPEAIVMRNVVNVKSSPDSSGADLFVIHEGIKVKISEQISDWYEIKLPNGEKGWIEKKDLEII